MRVLVISNLFPPHAIGGYELGCAEVVEALAARGHDVAVLTSTYGAHGRERDARVERALVADFPAGPRRTLGDRLRTVGREAVNRALAFRACRRHRPDVVHVWNLRFLTPASARVAQLLGHPVCYFVSDGWLEDAARFGWPLRTRGLDLRRVQFASDYLKRAALAAGQPVADAEVVYWGVDLRRFAFSGRRERRRLLYVGRLVPEKGLATALEALRLLVEAAPNAAATLTVVGGPDDRWAREEIRRLGVDGHVRLAGSVPREEMPGIYAAHDVLVFPSAWEEPFSITLLEGMASGLAVATTLTGGTGEVAEDGVNCLTFAPRDARGCAVALGRLLEEPELAERLCAVARRRVEERFLLDEMVDRIERLLVAAAEGAG